MIVRHHVLAVGSLETNCYIIPLEDHRSCALIDPGDEGDRIIACLKELGLTPRYILLTHGHFDHISALPDIAAVWPYAEIAIHRDDAGRLKQPPDLLLDEGSRVGPFRVIHLPGHTAGSVGFLLEPDSSAPKILYSGDTLFQGGVGRTDLPGGNQAALEASLDRLLAMDGDIAVYPGHGGPSTIAAEALARARGTWE
ncbi:MAG: MBL fold metallo-hydrolase [Treponema sp.]|jgi:glyoxylase-like metal-dependent hydrolase (beta-lactamase superfamily II)|nr:MBL fold metallo-hydrolase [Treponema sp.]